MNAYQRYMKMKALADFYESLSDDERRKLFHPQYENENKLQKQVVDCRDPYWRGVSQNIVGDGIFSAGTWLLKRLLGRL